MTQFPLKALITLDWNPFHQTEQSICLENVVNEEWTSSIVTLYQLLYSEPLNSSFRLAVTTISADVKQQYSMWWPWFANLLNEDRFQNNSFISTFTLHLYLLWLFWALCFCLSWKSDVCRLWSKNSRDSNNTYTLKTATVCHFLHSCVYNKHPVYKHLHPSSTAYLGSGRAVYKNLFFQSLSKEWW